MSPAPDLRIIALPAAGTAYNDSFYDAVREQGVPVVAGIWAGRWLRDNVRPTDVVHVHWPSFFYAAEGSAIKLLASFLKFVVILGLVRTKTRHFWWTAHNLLPHNPSAMPLLDLAARHLVIRAASRIFVHGAEAEKVLVARFPAARRKCVRIPHGHWIGHYQPDLTRAAARAALGIADTAFVYILFGQIKPYKNVEGLIQAFRASANADAVLLIAGKFSDAQYLQQAQTLAAGDARIRIDSRFIPDGEVSTYMAATDVMCIAYREILTSGTAMLALSFGRPVISIDRGFLRDVITPEAGVLIAPGQPAALEAAMRQVRDRRWDEAAITEHASRHRFEDATSACIAAYAQDASA